MAFKELQGLGFSDVGKKQIVSQFKMRYDATIAFLIEYAKVHPEVQSEINKFRLSYNIKDFKQSYEMAFNALNPVVVIKDEKKAEQVSPSHVVPLVIPGANKVSHTSPQRVSVQSAAKDQAKAVDVNHPSSSAAYPAPSSLSRSVAIGLSNGSSSAVGSTRPLSVPVDSHPEHKSDLEPSSKNNDFSAVILPDSKQPESTKEAVTLSDSKQPESVKVAVAIVIEEVIDPSLSSQPQVDVGQSQVDDCRSQMSITTSNKDSHADPDHDVHLALAMLRNSQLDNPVYFAYCAQGMEIDPLHDVRVKGQKTLSDNTTKTDRIMKALNDKKSVLSNSLGQDQHKSYINVIHAVLKIQDEYAGKKGNVALNPVKVVALQLLHEKVIAIADKVNINDAKPAAFKNALEAIKLELQAAENSIKDKGRGLFSLGKGKLEKLIEAAIQLCDKSMVSFKGIGYDKKS